MVFIYLGSLGTLLRVVMDGVVVVMMVLVVVVVLVLVVPLLVSVILTSRCLAFVV